MTGTLIYSFSQFVKFNVLHQLVCNAGITFNKIVAMFFSVCGREIIEEGVVKNSSLRVCIQ